jgi:HprK-related kinase A
MNQPLLPLVATRGVQVAIGPFLVRVRSELPGVRDYLERFYSAFPIRDSADAHFDVAVLAGRGARRWLRSQSVVVINGTRPFTPLQGRLAGPLFEWGLNWAIGRHSHRLVALHASVVERGGRAIIFPASPGAGKSTLAAALGFSGWRLLSDEFALIDPVTGDVWPIPRPVSLKEASIDLIRGRHPDAVFGPEAQDVNDTRFAHVRPSMDSIRRIGVPARPSWVIAPRWTAGAPTSLTPVTKARSLITIADQSFNYNYLGSEGFRTLDRLVRQCDCFSLTYSDIDDVIAKLTAMSEQ